MRTSGLAYLWKRTSFATLGLASRTQFRGGRAFRQMLAVMAAIFIVASLALGELVWRHPNLFTKFYAVLYAQLEQKQANEIVATLLKNNIPAERMSLSGELFSVRIEETRVTDAASLLKDRKLPNDLYDYHFKRDMVDGEPRELMLYVVGQELEKTISEIDGILEARVHLVLTETNSRWPRTYSASVFMEYIDGIDIPKLVPKIKMLLANGLAGLSYDKVSVALLPVSTKSQYVSITGETSRRKINYDPVLWWRDSSIDNLSKVFTMILVAIFALSGGLVLVYLRLTRNESSGVPNNRLPPRVPGSR